MAAKAHTELDLGNVLAIGIRVLVLAVNEPLQKIVWRVKVRVGGSLLAGLNQGVQECVGFLNPLVETLHFGETESQERSLPGTQVLHGTLGAHDLKSVVDRSIQVLLGAAELRTDKDTARNHGDNAGQLVVDIVRAPLVVDGQLEIEDFADFLVEDGVQTSCEAKGVNTCKSPLLFGGEDIRREGVSFRVTVCGTMGTDDSMRVYLVSIASSTAACMLSTVSGSFPSSWRKTGDRTTTSDSAQNHVSRRCWVAQDGRGAVTNSARW